MRGHLPMIYIDSLPLRCHDLPISHTVLLPCQRLQIFFEIGPSVGAIERLRNYEYHRPGLRDPAKCMELCPHI
jgi:hypothetical protein